MAEVRTVRWMGNDLRSGDLNPNKQLIFMKIHDTSKTIEEVRNVNKLVWMQMSL
jgi:hypothetical protein